MSLIDGGGGPGKRTRPVKGKEATGKDSEATALAWGWIPEKKRARPTRPSIHSILELRGQAKPKGHSGPLVAEHLAAAAFRVNERRKKTHRKRGIASTGTQRIAKDGLSLRRGHSIHSRNERNFLAQRVSGDVLGARDSPRILDPDRAPTDHSNSRGVVFHLWAVALLALASKPCTHDRIRMVS